MSARDICPKCGGMWTYHAGSRCPRPISDIKKSKKFTKEYCLALFDKIKHGDQEHQDWLEKEIKEYFK